MSDEPVNVTYAKCFATPMGQTVLAHLRKRTIEQAGWQPGAESSHGFYHEGKCSVVREIESRIEQGKKR